MNTTYPQFLTLLRAYGKDLYIYAPAHQTGTLMLPNPVRAIGTIDAATIQRLVDAGIVESDHAPIPHYRMVEK